MKKSSLGGHSAIGALQLLPGAFHHRQDTRNGPGAGRSRLDGQGAFGGVSLTGQHRRQKKRNGRKPFGNIRILR